MPDDAIDVAWVPGAFEIPLVADRMAGSGRYVAVLCLGAVIRGETTHDQHINRAVSLGIMEAGLRHGRAGLVRRADLRYARTSDPSRRRQRRQQRRARRRRQTAVGNKGIECAEAALEMVSLHAETAIAISN